MQRRPWTVPVLESLFWLPASLLPYLVRFFSGQITTRAEPFVALFVPLVLIYLLARTGRLQTPLRAVLLVLLVVGGIFATGLALAGMGVAQPDLVLAALDTNAAETGEFLRRFYTAREYAIVSILFISVVAFGVQWRSRAYWQPSKRMAWPLLALFAVQVAFLGDLKALTDRKPHLTGVGNEKIGQLYPIGSYPPFRPWIQVGQAARLRAQIADASSRSVDDLVAGVKLVEPARAPRTYVVVVTESVGRSHMGVYGYPRDTTPRLSALAAQHELVVFTDAVTSEAQTALALYQALTWTSPSQPKARGIVDLFTAAGFETSWISNQPGMGMFDSVASLLTEHAVRRVFLEHPRVAPANDPNVMHAPERPLNEKFRANFDDRVLPELDKVLGGPARDKLIVIHLMGSHTLYRARYPVSDEVFVNNGAEHPGLSPAQAAMIDEYDNSVRFGDKIMGAVIDRVRRVSGESFVVALSDHGEEVYDFRDFSGHTNAVLSPWMLEIPLVAWLSPDYRKDHPSFTAEVLASTSRPYIHRNFAATLADLSRISYLDLPESQSLLSPNFAATPRITGGRDYAEFKRTWLPDAAHANGMALLPARK